ncbi:MAG: DUF2815 family protein [Dehalococcoidales bacterium]
MAGKTKMNKITTLEFRASFPNLFEAVSFNNGKPKFSVVMIFPKSTDLGPLKAAARVAAQAFWPNGLPSNLRSPFRDGSEKVDWEGFGSETIFITASTLRKPGVVDRQLNHIIEPDKFYAGCYARATINAFAYDQAGNKGVSFGLLNVQFLRDGDSLAGGTKAEDDFEAVEGDDMFGDDTGATSTAGGDFLD